MFDVTVQVADVRRRLDGKLFLNILGSDKFASLLPFGSTAMEMRFDSIT